MTALLITVGALLVAMLGRAILPQPSWSVRDTEEARAEEHARRMEAIAMSVF
jgi:hypothetical protein